MASQTETTAKTVHSLNRDMAMQVETRFRIAEISSQNTDFALQTFANLEWPAGHAIQTLAAEILRGGFNRSRSWSPKQTHRPVQCHALAFAAIISDCHYAVAELIEA